MCCACATRARGGSSCRSSERGVAPQPCRSARAWYPASVSCIEHRDWLARAAGDAVGEHADDTALLPRRKRDALPLRGLKRCRCAGTGGRAFRTDDPARWRQRGVRSTNARAGDAPRCTALCAISTKRKRRADIGRWMPGYLEELPRAPRRIVFKRTSTQWGSLAPDGTLSLDLALVLARPSAFEYVLVHELCHLLHADHSRRFWREVEARFPTWRDERHYFHAEGRRLKARLRGLLAG
jgi:hypothetical protein